MCAGHSVAHNPLALSLTHTHALYLALSLSFSRSRPLTLAPSIAHWPSQAADDWRIVLSCQAKAEGEEQALKDRYEEERSKGRADVAGALRLLSFDPVKHQIMSYELKHLYTVYTLNSKL